MTSHGSPVVVRFCDDRVFGIDLIIVDVLLRAISGWLSLAWIKFVHVKYANAITAGMIQLDVGACSCHGELQIVVSVAGR